jgi:hypothetical protein
MRREEELVCDSEKGRPAWGERKSWCVIVRKEALHEERGRAGV